MVCVAARYNKIKDDKWLHRNTQMIVITVKYVVNAYTYQRTNLDWDQALSAWSADDFLHLHWIWPIWTAWDQRDPATRFLESSQLFLHLDSERIINIFIQIFSVNQTQIFFCKKCILTHCQHYRCSLFKSKSRYKFMLFSKCSFVTYMSSHFLFKRSWIAKFTDFFHSFRSIATILPYLVVSTVWSADDIGPM